MAAGFVTRRSERSIDCPVSTIVNGVDGDCAATPIAIANAVPSRTPTCRIFMMGLAATRYRKIGNCELPPVAGGDESGPVERMGALVMSAPVPQNFHARLTHGIGSVEMIGE